VRPSKKRKRRQRPRGSADSSRAASLTFPFRTETLLTIGVMTVLYTCIMVIRYAYASPMLWASPRFVVGVIFIMLLIQGYFWHFLFQVLRTAAYNEPDLPMTADWDPEGILYDLLIAVQCTVVSFVPLIAYVVFQLAADLLAHPFIALLIAFLAMVNLPFLLLMAVTHLPDLVRAMVEISPALPWLVIALIVLSGLYLPMALLAAVLHQTVRAALPWHVIPAILRVRWAYVETLILVVGVGGLGVVLQVLAEYVPILGEFLKWFIVFAGHTAVMHRLGAMYYVHRRALDWFPFSLRVI
jgi:hypothetical protein